MSLHSIGEGFFEFKFHLVWINKKKLVVSSFIAINLDFIKFQTGDWRIFNNMFGNKYLKTK